MKFARTAIAVAALAVASVADAQTPVDPALVANVLPGNDGFTLFQAGWHVMVDIARGTCLIERSGVDNNVIQMGMTRDGSFGYIGLFSQNAAALGDGEIRPVIIELGENVYYGSVVGVAGQLRGGYAGGYVVTPDIAFFEDIARQFDMIIRVADLEPIQVNLSGTLDALETARECMEAQLNQ